MIKLKQITENCIFPNKCILCGKLINIDEAKGICKICGDTLPYLNINACLSQFDINNGFSMLHYTDMVKKFAYRFKYQDDAYCARVLGSEMGRFFIERNLFSADIAVPVPIHRKRKRIRGFNQSYILAAEFSKICGIPVYPNVLKRIRNTTEQYLLSPVMRIENVKGAFTAKNLKTIKNKNILLIDDIYTTGSTINECTKVLKEAQAKNVYFFTMSVSLKNPITKAFDDSPPLPV